MTAIKPSTAFKAFANWVSSEVRAYMKDQVATHLDAVADLRDNDLEQTRYVYLKSKAAVYRLTLSSGAADDGDTVIHDNLSRRYVKVTGSGAGGKFWDVAVDALADRDAYDDEAANFAVFVADTGGGRAALYVKNSATSADWSDPFYFTGIPGDVAAAIVAASAKITLVDADTFGIVDSEGSNALKEVTFGNLRTEVLSTFFDTEYLTTEDDALIFVSLNDRVLARFTSFGPPSVGDQEFGATASDTGNGPYRGTENMRLFPLLVEKRLQGNNVRINVASYMDSWGGRDYFSGYIGAIALPAYNAGRTDTTALGWAGAGWCGLGKLSSFDPKGALAGHTVARAGTWTDNFGTDLYSPDTCSCQTTTVNDTQTITSTSTDNPVPSAIKLLTRGSGTFDYSWDGGSSWESEVTLSGTNRESVSLANVPATATWSLVIRNKSTTALILMGALIETAANGVMWHLLNAGGTQTAAKAAQDATAFADNLEMLDLHLVLIGTPINDRYQASAPVSTWKGYMQTIIDRIRAWRPSVDIVIVQPPNVAGLISPSMDDYAVATSELVSEKRVAALMFGEIFGSDQAVYDGTDADFDLLDGTNFHPGSAMGVYLVRRHVFNMLTS